MTSQVIRIANGGSIQVRTGVLRGIGPAGPVGPVGPQGQQGDIGLTGATGATGSVNDFSSLFVSSIATPVAANTITIVPLDTVTRDTLNMFTSSTAYTIPSAGSYTFNINVTFTKGGPDSVGGREILLNMTSPTSQILSQVSVGSNLKTDSKINLTTNRLMSQGDVLRLTVRHSDTLSLTIGAASFTCYRIGSGPQGLIGPQGPVGALGPQGIQGPQGVAGSASSGFATYENLRP